MRYLVLFIVFNLIVLNSLSQDKFVVDSLHIALRNTKNDSLKTRILAELSREYFGQDLLVSLSYINEALDVAKKSDDKVLILKMYRAKGGILTYIGIYDQAVENFLQSLSLSQEMNHLHEIAMLYNNIGAVYTEIDKNVLGLEYFFKAMEVYKSMPKGMQEKHKRRLGAIYNNIGNIYMKNDDFETSLTYYKKSYELAESEGDKKLITVVLKNQAEIYRIKKDFNKSIEFAEEALISIKQSNDKDELAKLYNLYATLYIDLSEFQQALHYSQLAIEISSQIGSNLSLQKALKNLYLINKKLNNFDSALKAHEQYKAISDSLINEKTISEITRAQLQFDYEKIEQERENKLLKARLLTVFTSSILLLALIIVGLLFFLSRIKSRQAKLQNEKLELDLEMKNKELTTNVMYLVRKNELINNVAKRLIQLKEKVIQENKKPVQDIVYELNSEVDKDIWQEFELRFQQVHTDFYDKIHKKHPDLSPAEERLCAFLRLNLSTKEIAAITHQSAKSIDVARARLRKKLNLTNTDANLVSYLSKI